MFFDDLSYLLGPQSVLEFVPPERWELYALLVLTLVMVTCCVPSSRQSSRGNEPKMIPYLVPYIGHVFSLLFNYSSTIAYGRKYLDHAQEPFFLLLKGVKTCLITSAEGASAVNRSHNEFPRTPFLLKVSKSFGISEHGIKLLQSPPRYQPRAEHSRQRTVIESALAVVHLELSPKVANEPIQNRFLAQTFEHTSWNKLPLDATVAVSEDSAWMSLTDWIRRTFSEASVNAMFGEAVLRIDPKFLDHVLRFDDKSWMLFSDIPRPWSTSMWTAKDKIMHTMIKYFNIPRDQRSDASEMVKKMEHLLHENGFQVEDIAAFITLVYSSSFTNAWKACYWFLSNLVHDDDLMEAIHAEVLTVPATPQEPNTYAKALSKCPKFLSVFHETLRTSAATGSWREAARETIVGGKTLRKGTTILVPHRQLLTDETAFGKDADRFEWDRFLNNEQLANHGNFRPWGGGAGICPGRFVAQAEILTFVARVICSYDIELAEPNEPVPQPNINMPSAGIMGPIGSQDVVLRIKPRLS